MMNSQLTPHIFTDLPENKLEKILRYLSAQGLLRIGQTCKNLDGISSPNNYMTNADFDLKFLSPSQIESFLHALPASLTHLLLQFPIRGLFAQEILLPIVVRCPNLQVLSFHKFLMGYNNKTIREVFFIFDHLPENLRVLICHKSVLCSHNFRTNAKSRPIYPLEVLDLSGSYIPLNDRFFNIFHRLVNLKELRLANTSISDYAFTCINPYVLYNLKVLDLEGTLISSQAFNFIKHWCHKLVELYLCGTNFTGDSMDTEKFNKLQYLEILCLQRIELTDVAIQELLDFCPSLNCMYLNYPPSTDVLTENEKVVVTKNLKPCNHHLLTDYI